MISNKRPNKRTWPFLKLTYHFLGEGIILEKKVIKETPLKVKFYAKYFKALERVFALKSPYFHFFWDTR